MSYLKEVFRGAHHHPKGQSAVLKGRNLKRSEQIERAADIVTIPAALSIWTYPNLIKRPPFHTSLLAELEHLCLPSIHQMSSTYQEHRLE